MSHLGQHRDDAVEESEGFADTVVTQETEPATDEQVLRLCQKAGLVKLGHVSLDGTKVGANASKHKAMSYERMLKTAEELGVEVEALLERAETVDSHEDARLGKDVRGDELPFELQRKKTRLRRIAENEGRSCGVCPQEGDRRARLWPNQAGQGVSFFPLARPSKGQR